jgi:hypothetical protein
MLSSATKKKNLKKNVKKLKKYDAIVACATNTRTAKK